MTADINIAYNQYTETACEETLEDIVRCGTGIVKHFAALYGAGMDYDDLYQTGMIGLLRAAQSFNSQYGATFSTWASACVISEIRHYVRRENAYRNPAAAESCSDKEQLQNEQVERKTDRKEQSKLLSLDGDTGEKYKMQSFHLAVEDKIALEQAMKKLGKLQRKVVDALFYRGLTQQQAADELGISQRRVSRLKCAAVTLLQQLLEPKSFRMVDNNLSFHCISGTDIKTP